MMLFNLLPPKRLVPGVVHETPSVSAGAGAIDWLFFVFW
ncbi:Uncharacterised protein [Escherichia coli]|nr:Uncharacterised protein [Escherichia coli]